MSVIVMSCPEDTISEQPPLPSDSYTFPLPLPQGKNYSSACCWLQRDEHDAWLIGDTFI